MVNTQTENESIIDQMLDPIYYKRFDIIIPAFNEEKRITPVLTKIADFISSYDLPWQVIVAVDGNDGTADIVKNFSDQYSFVELDRSSGRNGKGEAIKRVLKRLNGEYVILMDADNSVDFSTVLTKIPLIGHYDAVIMSRYNEKSDIPFLRKLLSRGFNMLVRVLTGLKVNDTQSGYKIFKTSKFIDALGKVGNTDTFYDVSLLYHLQIDGGRILESKTEYRHDEGSKFHPLGLVIGLGVSLVAFTIRHSRFYKYIPESIIKLYYRKFRWI